jgi:hypothetical protein
MLHEADSVRGDCNLCKTKLNLLSLWKLILCMCRVPMKCKRKSRAHRSACTVWINLQDNLLRAGLVFTFRFQIHHCQIKASQSELTRRWSQGKVRYVNCICHAIPASTRQDLPKDLIEGFPWRIMKGRKIALARLLAEVLGTLPFLWRS